MTWSFHRHYREKTNLKWRRYGTALLDSGLRSSHTAGMPAAATKTKSIYLVGGADEFSIKESAAKLADTLAPKKAGEFGLEVIDG